MVSQSPRARREKQPTGIAPNQTPEAELAARTEGGSLQRRRFRDEPAAIRRPSVRACGDCGRGGAEERRTVSVTPKQRDSTDAGIEIERQREREGGREETQRGVRRCGGDVEVESESEGRWWWRR